MEIPPGVLRRTVLPEGYQPLLLLRQMKEGPTLLVRCAMSYLVLRCHRLGPKACEDFQKRLGSLTTRLQYAQNIILPVLIRTPTHIFEARQYITYNLHEFIESPLCIGEGIKWWLAYATLNGLVQIYGSGSKHGSLSCDNLLVTGQGWPLISGLGVNKMSRYAIDQPDVLFKAYSRSQVDSCTINPTRFVKSSSRHMGLNKKGHRRMDSTSREGSSKSQRRLPQEPHNIFMLTPQEYSKSKEYEDDISTEPIVPYIIREGYTDEEGEELENLYKESLANSANALRLQSSETETPKSEILARYNDQDLQDYVFKRNNDVATEDANNVVDDNYSIGCVLYELFEGKPLISYRDLMSNISACGRIDERVANYNNYMETKLLAASNPLVHTVISMLLNLEDERQTTQKTSHCLLDALTNILSELKGVLFTSCFSRVCVFIGNIIKSSPYVQVQMIRTALPTLLQESRPDILEKSKNSWSVTMEDSPLLEDSSSPSKCVHFIDYSMQELNGPLPFGYYYLYSKYINKDLGELNDESILRVRESQFSNKLLKNCLACLNARLIIRKNIDKDNSNYFDTGTVHLYKLSLYNHPNQIILEFLAIYITGLLKAYSNTNELETSKHQTQEQSTLSPQTTEEQKNQIASKFKNSYIKDILEILYVISVFCDPQIVLKIIIPALQETEKSVYSFLNQNKMDQTDKDGFENTDDISDTFASVRDSCAQTAAGSPTLSQGGSNIPLSPSMNKNNNTEVTESALYNFKNNNEILLKYINNTLVSILMGIKTNQDLEGYQIVEEKGNVIVVDKGQDDTLPLFPIIPFNYMFTTLKSIEEMSNFQILEICKQFNRLSPNNIMVSNLMVSKSQLSIVSAHKSNFVPIQGTAFKTQPYFLTALDIYLAEICSLDSDIIRCIPILRMSQVIDLDSVLRYGLEVHSLPFVDTIVTMLITLITHTIKTSLIVKESDKMIVNNIRNMLASTAPLSPTNSNKKPLQSSQQAQISSLKIIHNVSDELILSQYITVLVKLVVVRYQADTFASKIIDSTYFILFDVLDRILAYSDFLDTLNFHEETYNKKKRPFLLDESLLTRATEIDKFLIYKLFKSILLFKESGLLTYERLEQIKDRMKETMRLDQGEIRGGAVPHFLLNFDENMWIHSVFLKLGIVIPHPKQEMRMSSETPSRATTPQRESNGETEHASNTTIAMDIMANKKTNNTQGMAVPMYILPIATIQQTNKKIQHIIGASDKLKIQRLANNRYSSFRVHNKNIMPRNVQNNSKLIQKYKKEKRVCPFMTPMLFYTNTSLYSSGKLAPEYIEQLYLDKCNRFLISIVSSGDVIFYDTSASQYNYPYIQSEKYCIANLLYKPVLRLRLVRMTWDKVDVNEHFSADDNNTVCAFLVHADTPRLLVGTNKGFYALDIYYQDNYRIDAVQVNEHCFLRKHRIIQISDFADFELTVNDPVNYMSQIVDPNQERQPQHTGSVLILTMPYTLISYNLEHMKSNFKFKLPRTFGAPTSMCKPKDDKTYFVLVGTQYGFILLIDLRYKIISGIWDVASGPIRQMEILKFDPENLHVLICGENALFTVDLVNERVVRLYLRITPEEQEKLPGLSFDAYMPVFYNIETKSVRPRTGPLVSLSVSQRVTSMRVVEWFKGSGHYIVAGYEDGATVAWNLTRGGFTLGESKELSDFVSIRSADMVIISALIQGQESPNPSVTAVLPVPAMVAEQANPPLIFMGNGIGYLHEWLLL